MESIKILHIADLHLDSKIENLGSRKSSQRRTEILLSLKNVLSMFSDAKIVLIAGDLFDGLYNQSTINYLCKLFLNYAETRFFISAGNHDSLSSEPMNKFVESMPENVHVFGESVSCITIEESGINVYGASFFSPSLYSSFLNGFHAENSNFINIMLMHGEIASEGKYNPFSLKDIENSNLDYLALGHVHTFSGINKSGKTVYAYPGVFEPRGFDECGSCGVIYGQISKGGCNLNFYPTCAREYHELDFNITGCSSDAEVIDCLASIVLKDNIYRINLAGTKTAGYIPNVNAISDSLNVFWCEVIDKAAFENSIFDYDGERSLRGFAAKKLKEYSEKSVYSEDELKDAAEILTSVLLGSDKL